MSEEKKAKKPDHVVFDEETQTYNASLLPYASSVSAPVIKPDDVNHWKNRGVSRVNHLVKSKFEEIKAEYEAMMEQFHWNDVIYRCKFTFEPVIGETYYLYENAKQEPFLSLIDPNSWNKTHLGTFRLNADQVWEKQKEEEL